MKIESTSIPEFVAYDIIGGTVIDLRRADRMLADLERQAPDPVRAGNLRAIRAAIEQLRHIRASLYQHRTVTGSKPTSPSMASENMRPPQEAISDADVTQVRQIVLDELRTAERDLADMQERTPDPTRAMDLKALKEATLALARLVANRSD